MNNKEIVKLINSYLNKEKKTILDIRKEWKQQKSYPMYSSQHYAFVELQEFWKELKKKVNKDDK